MISKNLGHGSIINHKRRWKIKIGSKEKYIDFLKIYCVLMPVNISINKLVRNKRITFKRIKPEVLDKVLGSIN